MNTSHVAAIMAAGMLLAIPLMTPAVYSAESTKTAVATIEQATCGLSIDAGNLDFGALTPDTIAPADNLSGLGVTLQNTGNTAASELALTASTWTDVEDTSATTILFADRTHWSITSDDTYAEMNAINFDPIISGGITPGTPVSVYFRLQAILVAGQENYSGDVTQTLIFTSSC